MVVFQIVVCGNTARKVLTTIFTSSGKRPYAWIHWQTIPLGASR